MNNSRTAVVIIQSDHLEWIKRHPEHFVNSLVTRIENEETDKYPGYARWHGDGIPGVQLVWVSEPEDKNQTCIISAGNGFGSKMMMSKIKNDSKKETKIELLKSLAEKLGFKLFKKG